MGIGNSKGITAVFAGLLAVSVFAAPAVQGFERTTGIWKVLREGHFSGAMNEDAHVTPIAGSIAAKGKTYRFMEFAWEESRKNAAGTQPHAQYRLLVFEQSGGALSYLGSYLYYPSDFRGDVHPKVRGKTVVLPYHDIEILGVKQAQQASFENGPPPSAFEGGFSR